MAKVFPSRFKSRDVEVVDNQLDKKLAYIKKNNPRFDERKEENKVNQNRKPESKLYDKWGLLIAIHTITDGDIIKAREIMNLPIFDVLTWLSLEDDIIKLKTESNKQHGN